MPKGQKPPPNCCKAGEPSRNPKGINGFSSGLQPFHKRAEYLLGKYSIEKIKEHANDLKWLSKNESSWDGIVWRRLAAMVDGRADERAEIALLLDRKEGKAVERREVRVIRSVTDLTDEELAAIAASSGSEARD